MVLVITAEPATATAARATPGPGPTATAQRRPGSTGVVFDGVDRWTALALGIAEFFTNYSRAALSNAEQRALAAATAHGREQTDGVSAADLITVLPGALTVLGLRLQRRLFDTVAGAEHAASRQIGRLGAVHVSSPLLTRLHGFLAGLDEQFKTEQRARAQVAADFLAVAGPETLDALLARIDVEALLHRVDLDAVIERVDLDRAVGRVDLDAVVARVDVDQVVSKVDVNELMSGVLGDLEVAELLRDSTGALANSTVGVLRNQVGGVANRITRRPAP